MPINSRGVRKSQVTTSKGVTVSAEAIVVATNTPVNDWVTIHTKQAAYRTYVIGVRVPKGSVTKALYWDPPDPHHYVRLEDTAGHDVLTNSTALAKSLPSPPSSKASKPEKVSTKKRLGKIGQ